MDASKFRHFESRGRRGLTYNGQQRVAGGTQTRGMTEEESGYTGFSGFCESTPPVQIRDHGRKLRRGRFGGLQSQHVHAEPLQEKTERPVFAHREQQIRWSRLEGPPSEGLKASGFGVEL